MEFKKIVWTVFKGGLLLLTVFLIACQGMQKTVTPEDRIPLLDGGPHSGNWESRTMHLDYQYYKHSVEIKLRLRIKAKTGARYDGYEVWVLFADDQGKILEEKQHNFFYIFYNLKYESQIYTQTKFLGLCIQRLK